MPKKIILAFSTPEELEALDLIKAITMSRTPKKGILVMAKTYKDLAQECAILKATQKSQHA